MPGIFKEKRRKIPKLAKFGLRNAIEIREMRRKATKSREKLRPVFCDSQGKGDFVMSAQLNTNKLQVALRDQPKRPEKIAVIVPCYNEAQRLELDTFLEFARGIDDFRLIFVDDGSKDQTISLLCGAMAALPDKVDALIMKENGGKAEAVRQGLKFAAKRGHKYIAFLDADLATPIDAILDFASVADRMPEIDVVFGSRKGGLGHRVYREFHRKIISKVCATLGRLATGLPISDTQCGAKLFRNTPAFWRALENPFSAGWLFDVELFLRISDPDKKKRNKFFEYPVIEWTEIPGSKIKSSDVIKSGFKMLGLIANQWKIREHYSRRKEDHLITNYQILRSGKHMTRGLIAELPSFVNILAPGVILDFRAVETFDPSVFTALMVACDHIKNEGLRVKIRLPEDEAVLAAARNTGLIATVDCTKVKGAPGKIGGSASFDVVEA